MNLPSWPDLNIRQGIGKRVYSLRQYIANTMVWRFRRFLIAGAVGSVGIGFAIAGAVLVALMAVSGGALSVIGAGLMFGLGVVLTVAVYLWLTL